MDENEVSELGRQGRETLAAGINEMINNDFSGLINLLYRFDIDEKKLRHLLIADSGKDAGIIIADLLIERQIQKEKTRLGFDGSDVIMDFQDKLRAKYKEFPKFDLRKYQLRNLFDGSTGVSDEEAPYFDLPDGEFEQFIRNGFTEEGIDFTPKVMDQV